MYIIFGQVQLTSPVPTKFKQTEWINNFWNNISSPSKYYAFRKSLRLTFRISTVACKYNVNVFHLNHFQQKKWAVKVNETTEKGSFVLLMWRDSRSSLVWMILFFKHLGRIFVKLSSLLGTFFTFKPVVPSTVFLLHIQGCPVSVRFLVASYCRYKNLRKSWMLLLEIINLNLNINPHQEEHQQHASTTN
jgi:hypothetical protein